MLTNDPQRFLELVAGTAPSRPAVPRGIFMVSPDGFRVEEECAADNRYMRIGEGASEELALRQFHALARKVASLGVPTTCFPGNPETADAVFPNNVFATVPGRVIVGGMYHPSRRREAEREDIRGFFTEMLGYELLDLSGRDLVAELTGPLIIDRARGLGFCGMSERVDAAGAIAMHDAFRLAVTLAFDLAPGEYHTNVVMSVLAGRAVVLQPEACASAAAADAILGCFEHRIVLDADEIAAFAGNCLAVTERDVLMSERASDGLRAASRAAFERGGFRLHAVDVSELEKAGGSVRCMLGEIF